MKTSYPIFSTLDRHIRLIWGQTSPVCLQEALSLKVKWTFLWTCGNAVLLILFLKLPRLDTHLHIASDGTEAFLSPCFVGVAGKCLKYGKTEISLPRSENSESPWHESGFEIILCSYFVTVTAPYSRVRLHMKGTGTVRDVRSKLELWRYTIFRKQYGNNLILFNGSSREF